MKFRDTSRAAEPVLIRPNRIPLAKTEGVDRSLVSWGSPEQRGSSAATRSPEPSGTGPRHTPQCPGPAAARPSPSPARPSPGRSGGTHLWPGGWGSSHLGQKGVLGCRSSLQQNGQKGGLGLLTSNMGCLRGGGQILNFFCIMHISYCHQKPYDLIINLILVKICISGTIYILCVMKNGEICIFCILYFCNFTDLFLRGVNG